MRKMLVLITCICALQTSAVYAGLSLETVATGLSQPVFLGAAPGDDTRLFILQQTGQIVILRDGSVEPAPFLDIASKMACCGERGLLGLAFHPDYASNGLFFVNYTRGPDGATVVSRFSTSTDPDLADPNSEQVLLSFSQPFTNHNGGMMAFSPQDGYLYINSGDGGSGNDPNQNAQALDTLLGKILRIDVDEGGEGAGSGGPDYDIPPTNPFLGVPGAREEIWAYGLRNPWRGSFDRNTGDLWIGDVGQNLREELNFQPASSPGGENYGWRTFEGNLCNPNVVSVPDCATLQPQVTFPVHEYPNPQDGRAITAGYLYRGVGMPGRQGTYFFADYASARVWSFRYPNQVMTDFQELTSVLDPAGTLLAGLSSFGEDARGELYLLSLSGKIYKLVEDEAFPCDDTLPGSCPPIAAEGASAYAALGETWATADLDANTIPDAWEAGLMLRLLCGTQHPLQPLAVCAYQKNLAALAAEADYPALAPYEHAIAALLALSTEMQQALRFRLGLTNTYTAVEAAPTGQPLAAASDPDGDSFPNVEEAANLVTAGGAAEDYAESVLNPILDGTQLLSTLSLGWLVPPCLLMGLLLAMRRVRFRAHS